MPSADRHYTDSERLDFLIEIAGTTTRLSACAVDDDGNEIDEFWFWEFGTSDQKFASVRGAIDWKMNLESANAAQSQPAKEDEKSAPTK